MAKKKLYTQDQALKEIFYNNENPLSDLQLVQKHRYTKGTLSQKIIDSLLKEFNFVIKKEAIYTKKV